MAGSRIFVDTWGWLVLANRRDPAFAPVRRLRDAALDALDTWVTTDYVLDETFTRLFASTPFPQARRFAEGLFEAADQGSLDIEQITAERFTAAWHLRLRYVDKPAISFTDLTSFVVMRELGIERAVTADAHYTHIGMGFRCLP